MAKTDPGSVSARATSYDTLWDGLTQEIVSEHTFPYNQPLYDAYIAAGATPAALNLSSPVDQEYIRNVWYAFLAPRQCSADWECKQFLRHGTAQCIFDSLGYIPWRNGDPAFASGVTGDEGG